MRPPRRGSFSKFGRVKKNVEPEEPLDYKNINYLSRFLSPQGKIHPRKRTGFSGQKPAQAGACDQACAVRRFAAVRRRQELMEVLLKRSIEHLGRIGDVVTVQAGYARNYLLPLGHAVLVTKANVAQLEKQKVQALAEEASRVSDIKATAEKMAATSVTIEGRANDEGHLFGSVNAAQVAAALRERGFSVDEKAVRLEAPLKEIGVFDVVVHLHPEVDANVKVWVVQAKPE